jgi:hypothetical protein
VASWLLARVLKDAQLTCLQESWHACRVANVMGCSHIWLWLSSLIVGGPCFHRTVCIELCLYCMHQHSELLHG